jgi:hypothetical protein
MTLPPLLRFTPVPLKSRHDGWSPELQTRFVVALARGFSIARAARLLGKTRTTAYALRQRPGAESFASAWDAALAHAKCVRIAAEAGRPAAPVPPRPAAAARVTTPADAADVAARRRAAEAALARFYRESAGEAVKGGEAAKAAKTDRGCAR